MNNLAHAKSLAVIPREAKWLVDLTPSIFALTIYSMMEQKKQYQLDRGIGLFQATALVVGSMIGSGIFVSTAAMARSMPSGIQLMGIWALAGLITSFGALSHAELSSRIPVTGGLYAYFREVFGDTIAFFYGWANFMIAGSGAIAAIAYIFSSYLSEFIPLWHASPKWEQWTLHIPFLGNLNPAVDLGEKIAGSLLIFFLTALNVRGVRLGAFVQSISASAKTLALLVIVAVAFGFAKQGTWQNLTLASTKLSSSGFSLIGIWFVAMGGAFWSYDGWGNIGYVGDEIRSPQKNLPRAIFLGTGIVIAVYLLVNLAYLYVLPLQSLGEAKGDRVASAMMHAVLGPAGVALISALILLTTFDTVNSTVLTNARVYFAMAKEKLFWQGAAHVHPQHKTPDTALWLQGAWSIILLLTGSFDLITSMYVFVNWLFYLLIPISLFILRARSQQNKVPENKSIFEVPLYPLLPFAFALFTFAYLTQTLFSDIEAFRSHAQQNIKSLMGLALVGSGAPFYFIWKSRKLLSK